MREDQVVPRDAPIVLPMIFLNPVLPIAAIGWSLLYLLFGGGLIGAVVIYFIAKLFRK